MRTWVKKGSYLVTRTSNKPKQVGEFSNPGWRVRITKPTLRTIDHKDIPHHRILNKVA